MDADVAVLGSGFGGSLSALVLARLGLRVVVIDRAAHPRFAIGESSTPIADRVLRDLAVRYDLPQFIPLTTYGSWQRHYPHLVAGRKRGFSYFYHRPGEPFRTDAAHASELLVAASADDDVSDTHWLRADVDGFFAGAVRRAGIPLLENTSVEARPEGEGWRLEGTGPEGPLALRVRFVVDATGAGGVLPRALDLVDPAYPFHTHSRALFSHFTGVASWGELLDRWGFDRAEHPFRCDDAALHHVFDGGWMWMLRFNNGVVSAGFALDPRRHPVDPAVPPETEWRQRLAAFPALQEQLGGAAVVAPPGGLVRTGRLQRRMRQAAGPTWALLPYTAGFVDPLHSTGIAHTLCGIERLAALFEAHWGRPSLAAALDGYSAAVLRELALVDALVGACYAAASSFRLYTATVLLYFAAVVTYERQRLRTDGLPPDRLFLGADDAAFAAVVDGVLARLAALRQRGTPDEAALRAFEAHVEAAIAPYNPVGLFHPPHPNMYHHTAARG